jgi:DNA/RNA-binding domain of Phe-tRNA-synthetase-like protein
MIEIGISTEFRSAIHEVHLGCLMCDVAVNEECEPLWDEIDRVCNETISIMKVEDISQNPAIAASRKVYRALGKDPARYRLSAEALMRRIVKGYGLYRVNNVVDIVNLVSLKTGFSIGGYDIDKINFPAELSVGRFDDHYEGIGRGELNIESLPVLRDVIGAFGSPTSDSVRTSVTAGTTQFLMVIFGFGNFEGIQHGLNYAETLLLKYAGTTNCQKWISKS